MDTIFAQATAPGKAGVSIIRISGPDARSVMAHFSIELLPRDRKLCRLLDADGQLIDIAFVLSFENEKSFTGEEVVELHLHGAPAIVSVVTGILRTLGLRHAEPGEFTRRALENGCLDLAQVEGLADLIDAETEEQRRQAVRVFDGGLGALVETWRSKLIRAAALLEATIDFADEDVPEDVFPEVRALLSDVHRDLSREAAGVHIRERIRDGFEVAIVGPPNIGKSTLLNRLAGREVAITSEFAGTTRDVIEVRMDLQGIPVTVLDTAGIRSSEDHVEAIGVERALTRAKSADIRVHMIDIGGTPLVDVLPGDVVVIGKGDLIDQTVQAPLISGVTGEGVDRLISLLGNGLRERIQGAGTATRLRHKTAIEQGAVLTAKVIERLADGGGDDVDLLAEDLRTAIRALDSLVGRIDVETLLDEIFSSFCIGK